MSDLLVVTHTVIAILAIVVLIVGLRIEAVIALTVGTLYLGLATGLGGAGTVEAIALGFGDVLSEVGLLIIFGVLMGRLLSSMGVLERISAWLMRVIGPKGLPYAFGATLNAGFSAIIPDVILVIVAPLARTLGRNGGKYGTYSMSAALTAAMYVGVGITVPGVGALALAGVLKVPLATMILFGYGIGLPTVVLTIFVMNRLAAVGWWNVSHDEEADAAEPEAVTDTEAADTEPADAATAGATRNAGRQLPIGVILAPLALTLGLVVAAALAEAFEVEIGWLAFLGNPLVALFIGMVLTYCFKLFTSSRKEAGQVTSSGLKQIGSILALTGIGGALAEVIAQSGMEEVLRGLFSASVMPPLLALLLAWLVAAILHVAIGSVLVSGLTAASILGPVLGGMDVSTVLIALSAGAGSIFGAHVNSNVFWMFKDLMRLSVRGTFKVHTMTMSVASVIALLLCMILSLVV